MDQFISTWASLSLNRRILVVSATVGVFVSVYVLAQLATQPRMALLYSGLEPSSAGEVVSELEARGAIAEVRGSAIYVDAAQRDELRLSLASQGLPSTGGDGYELLDGLSGFGTTSQMFDATYWRAKEGELARTIAANRQFAAVRVHISNPASNPFKQGRVDTASVSISMVSGSLTQGQATALRYLVASAVAGLQPDKVSIIDSVAGLIPNEDGADGTGSFFRNSKEEELRQSVTRLLEARVGAKKAVVEVSVETTTDREEITERRFDPDTRVAISSQTDETTNSSTGQSGTPVTVASNLPDGDAGTSAGNSQSSETRTREVINYEVAETQRAILKQPGSIKRITVAALIDGDTKPLADGSADWQPRSDEELSDLRELISSAVGFNPDRGDTITIRSMQFQPEPAFEAPLPTSFLDRLSIDVMSLLQLAVLAVVSLILGLFVVRPILIPQGKTALALNPPSNDPIASDPEYPKLSALDGSIEEPDDFTPLGDLPAFDNIQNSVEPGARLRGLIEQKQEETVEVLSQWMSDPKEASR